MFDTTIKIYIAGTYNFIFLIKINITWLVYCMLSTKQSKLMVQYVRRSVKFIIQNSGAENHQSNKLTASNCRC